MSVMQHFRTLILIALLPLPHQGSHSHHAGIITNMNYVCMGTHAHGGIIRAYFLV